MVSETLCACGCGEKTSIATRTDTRVGRVKGKPNKYVKGHNAGQRALGNTCKIEGCENRSEARGWCKKHYMRWRTTGDPESATEVRVSNRGLCKIQGCERQAVTRGWCTAHYGRWQKYGDPEAGGPLREPKKITVRQLCAWPEGCKELERSRGFCAAHYNRVRHSAKYESLLPAKFRAERCMVPECGLPQYANGFCRNHYEQARHGNDPIAKLDAPPVDYETFGGRLFVLRCQKGWSLEEVGDRVGLTRERIRQLEKREQPPEPRTIGKLAKAFGVDASALIGDQAPAHVGTQKSSERKPGRPRKEHLHISCLWCRGRGLLSLAEQAGDVASLEAECAYCKGSGAIYISAAPPLSQTEPLLEDVKALL